MKNLSLISFVGVDSQTELERLKIFSEFNMIYEFGILYSDSKNGKYQRYPAHDFSKNYLKWAKNNNVKSSLHLCGSSIDRYLNEDQSLIELCSYAGRIQLNFNIQKYDNYNDLSNKIIQISNKYNNHIILQNNNSKKEFNEIFISKLPSTSLLSLLHDASGGFGRQITKVFAPDSKYFTGYAGGINPNNVSNIISIIEKSNTQSSPYYIDMESGVRIDNIFSIDECDKIRQLINSKLQAG